MAIIKPNNNTISAITALPAAIETGSLVKLSSANLATTDTIEFNNTLITDTYKTYELHLTATTGTNDWNFRAYTSTDNGSNYNTGASDYAWTFISVGSQGSYAGSFDQDDGNIPIAHSLSDGNGFPFITVLRIFNPTNSALPTTFLSLPVAFHQSNDDIKPFIMSARRQATEDNNAIKFASDNTFSSGFYTLYGVKS